MNEQKDPRSKRPMVQCYEDINDKFDQFSLDSTVGKLILLWHIKKFQRPPSRFAMPTWIVLDKGKKSQDLDQLDNDIDVLYEQMYS